MTQELDLVKLFVSDLTKVSAGLQKAGNPQLLERSFGPLDFKLYNLSCKYPIE